MAFLPEGFTLQYDLSYKVKKSKKYPDQNIHRPAPYHPPGHLRSMAENKPLSLQETSHYLLFIIPVIYGSNYKNDLQKLIENYEFVMETDRKRRYFKPWSVFEKRFL